MGAYGSPDLTQHVINNDDVVYCVKCGTAINKGYKFCPNCGNKKKKSKWWLWVLIIFFAVPIILFNLILIFSFIETFVEL